MAEIAMLKYTNINLCPLIDARRMEVYNLVLDEKGVAKKEITADIIDESSYEEYLPFVYFGDGAKKLEEIWKGRDCRLASEIKSSGLRNSFSLFKI